MFALTVELAVSALFLSISAISVFMLLILATTFVAEDTVAKGLTKKMAFKLVVDYEDCGSNK